MCRIILEMLYATASATQKETTHHGTINQPVSLYAPFKFVLGGAHILQLKPRDTSFQTESFQHFLLEIWMRTFLK